MTKAEKKILIAPDDAPSTVKAPPTRDPAQEAADQQRADQRAAENRANARADAERRKMGQRYLTQAGNLEAQAAALRKALQSSFGAQLQQGLADVARNLADQTGLLRGGAAQRGKQLHGAAHDNQKATADTAEQARSNLTRERADAMAGLMEHGAGETDTMRAMLMSARNWHANASENSRSYFDTARSINQSIVDLNVDTRTALGNMYGAAEAERDRLYQDYYSRRAETLTQIGNIKGQQADYYAMAKEMDVSPGKGKEAKATADMKWAYGESAKEQGKSYEQKALPAWVKQYNAAGLTESRQSNTNLAAAVTIDKAEKADGASLRRWAG